MKRERVLSEASYDLDLDGNETIAATSYAGRTVGGSDSSSSGKGPEPNVISIRGQAAVRFSKVLVIFVLILAAAAGAYVTYLLVTNEEQTEFRSQVSMRMCI